MAAPVMQKTSSKKPMALVLAQNFKNYQGGGYHEDILDAIRSYYDVRIYGPGHAHYNADDCIDDVLRKLELNLSELSYIICGTSWDRPGQTNNITNVDIHPAINLSSVKGPAKIFYLNKEYINLPEKVAYSNRQDFDFLITNAPRTYMQSWEKKINAQVIYASFGIPKSWLKGDLKCEDRDFDFLFSGAMHDQYLDDRWLVKKNLFRAGTAFHFRTLNWLLTNLSRSRKSELFRDYLNVPANQGICRLLSVRNPVRSSLRVYWAERTPLSKTLLFETLLPGGDSYRQLVASANTALCTRSAVGIIGPRYFELWSQGTIPVSFRTDKTDLQMDQENSIIIDQPGELEVKVTSVLEDKEIMTVMRQNGRRIAANFTYHKIIRRAFGEIHA